MPDTLAFAPPPVQAVYGPAARPPRSRGSVVLDWLASQPLVAPAVGLAVGISIDAAVPVPFWGAAAGFVAAGGLLLHARRGDAIRHLAITLAAMAVGAVLYDVHFRHWPDDHIVRYCSGDPTPARLTGTLVQTPLIVASGSGRITWIPQLPRTRLLIDASQLQGVVGPIGVSGLVAVTVHEPVLGVSPGDCVQLFGLLRRPMAPANPGERDWALMSRRNGVLVEMSCEHAANVTVVTGGSWPAHWLSAIRRRACAAMREQAFNRDAPGARLLDALVLGQRSAVDADLNQAFVNTGTIH